MLAPDVRQDRARGYLADDTYFTCVSKRDQHKIQPWYDIHPDALTVCEDAIDLFVAWFFHERFFGPRRLTDLEGPADEPVRSDHQAAAAIRAER